MRRPIALAFLLLASPLLAAPAPLDGTVWNIRVTPDARARAEGQVAFSDQLVFRDGKLNLPDSVKHGFSPTEYLADTTATGYSWSATLRSETEGGTALWDGTTKAEVIAGNLIWSKPDGKIHRFTFKGKRYSGRGY